MSTATIRVSAALAALAALLPIATFAASKPFAGLSGWEHPTPAVTTAPAGQAPRAQDTWKKRDGEFVTYLADGGLSYDDVIALVKKNIADNGLKTPVDTDRTCDGRRAHEFELVLGTTVIHQVIVDDAPGVTKLTYARPQEVRAGADVTTAIEAYCGPSR